MSFEIIPLTHSLTNYGVFMKWDARSSRDPFLAGDGERFASPSPQNVPAAGLRAARSAAPALPYSASAAQMCLEYLELERLYKAAVD